MTHDPPWDRERAPASWLYLPPAAAAVLALQSRSCRWPLGETEHDGFGFCRAPAHRGAYCAAHRRLALRRPS